ncbi:hypothetical protein CPB84DRAFT_1751393 [Gymnopilus junonius]|uniref:Uncharacterized protein n=1 Tax=Gymnopilus junonius TaxID=109634 RepID=A0A9P5TIK9_GYMJU|nr:hypothetical protein CPB84DRAFT_1751393 [Gymnopilus junonius]
MVMTRVNIAKDNEKMSTMCEYDQDVPLFISVHQRSLHWRLAWPVEALNDHGAAISAWKIIEVVYVVKEDMQPEDFPAEAEAAGCKFFLKYYGIVEALSKSYVKYQTFPIGNISVANHRKILATAMELEQPAFSYQAGNQNVGNCIACVANLARKLADMGALDKAKVEEGIKAAAQASGDTNIRYELIGQPYYVGEA